MAAGSKISPRSNRLSAYSWKETSTKAEDWLPVLPRQEDLFRRSPGGAYQAQYNLPSNAATFGGNRMMAWEYGPSGHISLERVNSWLASLEQACIPPPDTIEFVNAYGNVVKMVRQPYEKKNPHNWSTKESSSSFSSPPPHSRTPMRNFLVKYSKSKTSLKEKGKSKALTTDEEKPFVLNKSKLTDEEECVVKQLVQRVSKAVDTVNAHKHEHPELNRVISEALEGNTWYNKPSLATKDLWLQDIGYPISNKTIAHPQKLEQLCKNQQNRKVTTINMPISNDIVNRFKEMDASADTILTQWNREETRPARAVGVPDILVNLREIGWVNHNPETPIWQIPRYCYLTAISDEGLQLGKWSSYPTIYSLSRFYGTWRRNVGFDIKDTENRQFHICLNPTGLGWARIDRLANSSLSYKCVGGEGLTSSIKMLDGTNYQEWAQKLEA